MTTPRTLQELWLKFASVPETHPAAIAKKGKCFWWCS